MRDDFEQNVIRNQLVRASKDLALLNSNARERRRNSSTGSRNHTSRVQPFTATRDAAARSGFVPSLGSPNGFGAVTQPQREYPHTERLGWTDGLNPTSPHSGPTSNFVESGRYDSANLDDGTSHDLAANTATDMEYGDESVEDDCPERKSEEQCQTIYDGGVGTQIAKIEDLIAEKPEAREAFYAAAQKLDDKSYEMWGQLGVDIAMAAGGAVVNAKEGTAGVVFGILADLLGATINLYEAHKEIKEIGDEIYAAQAEIDRIESELEFAESFKEDSLEILSSCCEGRYTDYPASFYR